MPSWAIPTRLAPTRVTPDWAVMGWQDAHDEWHGFQQHSAITLPFAGTVVRGVRCGHYLKKSTISKQQLGPFHYGGGVSYVLMSMSWKSSLAMNISCQIYSPRLK
jgi:hypothetical protein